MALSQGSTGMRVGWTLNQLYEDGKLLRRWQVAQTAQLDKSNGKAGPKAVRLINIMCPLGKVFLGAFGKRKSVSCMIFVRLHEESEA